MIGNPPVGSDPFLLLYTSGTTSNPKGVPLTYQNMLGHARLCAPEFGMTSEDSVLSAAPLSHFMVYIVITVRSLQVLPRYFFLLFPHRTWRSSWRKQNLRQYLWALHTPPLFGIPISFLVTIFHQSNIQCFREPIAHPINPGLVAGANWQWSLPTMGDDGTCCWLLQSARQ